MSQPIPLPSFPSWSDGMLPELQHVLAMVHLDVFSRRTLSITCRAYLKRWYLLSMPIVRASTLHVESQISHALGRWAPVSYLYNNLKRVARYVNNYEHYTSMYEGLIREHRDADVFLLLEEQAERSAMDIYPLYAAYANYRDYHAWNSFREHYQSMHTFWTKSDINQYSTTRWLINHMLDTNHNAIVDLTDGAVIQLLIDTFLLKREEHWHDNNDLLYIHWDVILQATTAAATRLLRLVQDPAMFFRFIENISTAIESVSSWIRLWSFFTPEQQSQLYRTIARYNKESPSFFFRHLREMLAIIENIGLVWDLQLAVFVGREHVVIPWTDPCWHSILEHYWKAGKLDLSKCPMHPTYTNFIQSISMVLQGSLARDNLRTLDWFTRHQFPGSALYILDPMRTLKDQVPSLFIEDPLFT